jgi:phosphatidate cytidylyltransferase
MNLVLYLIILTYFLIGGVVILYINTKFQSQVKKHNWLKYFTFFIIINLLFISVMFNVLYFHYLSIIIILISFFEVIRLIIITGKLKTGIISLFFLALFSFTFIGFSLLEKQLLIIVIFIVSIFDGFSQLSGQLFGKIKILPLISPNKTVEGMIGGFLFSIISSALIFKMLNKEFMQSLYFGFGISTFAFLGDLSASYIKRNFGVKDYSRLLPGIGGVLDKFDSLIFCGSFIYIIRVYIHL